MSLIYRSTLVMALLLIALNCEKKQQQEAVPLCDIHVGPCEGRLDDGTLLRFDIGPKPVRALEKLQYDLVLEKDGVPIAEEAAVTLDMKMPAMYMGENQVKLVSTAPGHFVGTGSVVRCSSGDRLWDAGLKIERAGKTSEFHFRFETAP